MAYAGKSKRSEAAKSPRKPKSARSARSSGSSRSGKPGDYSRAAAKATARKPVKAGARSHLPTNDEGGPLSWLLPMLESSYTRLGSRAAAPQAAIPIAKSSYRRQGGTTLARSGAAVWRDILLEYKQRKAAAIARPPRGLAPALPPAPAIPGARNWLPLGPSVVLNGQTVGSQPVGGRVARLAIAPGGSVIYAASANGGVFRSTDGGTTWHSTMDSFDLDPTSFASASLSCGAIAIDRADPNRVYVGTGEGDTLQLFRARIVNALPAYRGVGVIRSDDGGTTWIAEPSSPDLAGEAFFDLAVDPGNRENVCGATTQGLYRRTAGAGGTFQWIRVRDGVHSSVVVASKDGGTRFFCAQWGPGTSPPGVFHSDDGGNTWDRTGTGFPTDDIGRIAIGAQADNPNVIYAFVARNSTGAAHGLYRLDGIAATWKAVGALPDVLPVDNGNSQGDYDLAIAVDPADQNLVFLGGSYVEPAPYPASIWRCAIQAVGSQYKVQTATSIGTHAHADVHSLIHTPGDPTELWCTCDGGIFLNRSPRGNGEFASQNNGLACLCCNFFAQHPTDPNILFTGLQDNGTARTAAGPIWTHVMGGDGGYCLINSAKPALVLVYANGTVYRSDSGGTSESGWKPVWNFGWATMTQPIVGPPYNPSSPGDANVVGIAAGQFVYVSQDFANTWPKPMTFQIPGGDATGDVFAMAFASPTRLFMGTTRGHVFRADQSGNSWAVAQLDNAPAGPMDLDGLINDVAVDWADTAGRSVYVAFGGMGDRRRVWHFDGSKWEVRSGQSGGNQLLDVEHNALAVDQTKPSNVYVGADIGVWHTTDGGLNWSPLENGLPDAPVFDLQIHPTQRLLRVATHGRGLYEMPLE